MLFLVISISVYLWANKIKKLYKSVTCVCNKSEKNFSRKTMYEAEADIH